MAKKATANKTSGAKTTRGKKTLPNTTVAQEQQIQRGMTAQAALENHFSTIKKLKAELDQTMVDTKQIRDEVNGRYRSALKQFKKDGGDIDVLIETLADLKRDQDVVIKRHLDRQRYGVFAGTLPKDHQLTMFPDRMPAAAPQADAAGEGEALSLEQRIEKAKADGYAAGKDGKFATDNPHEEGSPEYLAWHGRYNDAQAELARRFEGTGSKQPTHDEPAHA